VTFETHRNLTTTARYVRASEDQARAAMKRLDSLVG
jgi:hypothetical protein